MESDDTVKRAFERLSTYLLDITKSQALDLETIIPIVINLMAFVEGANGLSGLAKKKLILDCLLDFVEAHVEDPLKDDLKAFIAITLPGTIDKLIDVSSGRTLIKVRTPPCCEWLLKKMCCIKLE